MTGRTSHAGRALTVEQRTIRAGVLDLNGGYCVLGCGRTATNYAHRLPEGQGGPYTAANGLGVCGSGTTGDHWRTEQARELSYACGWLLKAGSDPETTPALIITVMGEGWHILGHDVRTAELDEIPGWMWPGTFEAAATRLEELTSGSAA